VFPGQGSQKVGMGQDLYQSDAEVRDLFALADKVSGLPITRLCFEGPMEALTETIHLQPAITAVNLACLAVLQKAGIRPIVCAGHSLGEFSALHAAGVVSMQDCFELVYQRGLFMHREAIRRQGAMSAIIGLDIDQVDAILSQAVQAGIVAVANHNSAEQIVITGEPKAVQKAADLAVAQGARAMALKVSGAWHSPLIQGAIADFQAFLETVAFRSPAIPVIHNVTAETEKDPARIRILMANQLCSPVRWFDIMRYLATQSPDAFVEIGPGRVLTGLLKKYLPPEQSERLFNVYDLKSLDRVVHELTS
jgi:[acyl-carrier-protein] S-malonyltransferase